MEFFLVVAMSFGFYLVLPVLVLWVRDLLFAGPATAEGVQAQHDRFQARLRSPDFGTVEAHFGHALPAALRDLYADLQEVTRSEFEVVPPDGADPIYIDSYNPADSENLNNAWPGCEGLFDLAEDGGGNGLLVDPTLDDPPVLWHEHETGEIETVARSLTEFMQWPRRPAQQVDD